MDVTASQSVSQCSVFRRFHRRCGSNVSSERTNSWFRLWSTHLPSAPLESLSYEGLSCLPFIRPHLDGKKKLPSCLGKVMYSRPAPLRRPKAARYWLRRQPMTGGVFSCLLQAILRLICGPLYMIQSSVIIEIGNSKLCGLFKIYFSFSNIANPI